MIDEPRFDEDDDRLAGELVLGLLTTRDRDAAELRVLSDPAFASLVEDWRTRLEPLDAAYVPVAPPASVKAALEARLFGDRDRTGFWASLLLWRGLAAAGIAVAVALAVLPGRQPDTAQLLATLANAETGLQLVAMYDRTSTVLKLNHVTGSPGPDRDYELWVIAGDNPPASLGLVSAAGQSEFVVPEPLRPHFSAAYALAISDEPAGGSPTGAPTGAVLAVGPAVEI